MKEHEKVIHKKIKGYAKQAIEFKGSHKESTEINFHKQQVQRIQRNI